MPKTGTYVIILKITEEKEIDYSTAIFGKQKSKIKTVEDKFELKEPVIIIPTKNGNSQIKSIEVIPITEQMIIHTRNMKRRITP